MIIHAIVLVSTTFAEVIVNDVPAVLAVTHITVGTVTVPSDWIVNCILLLAVTFVVDTTTVPQTSVAIPIVAFVPSLTYSPSHAIISLRSLKCVLPVATSIALKSAAAVNVGFTYNQRVIPFAPHV